MSPLEAALHTDNYCILQCFALSDTKNDDNEAREREGVRREF